MGSSDTWAQLLVKFHHAWYGKGEGRIGFWGMGMAKMDELEKWSEVGGKEEKEGGESEDI